MHGQSCNDVDQLPCLGSLKQPELCHERQCTYDFLDDKLFRIGQSLNHKRKDIPFQACSANKDSDSDDRFEEATLQHPIGIVQVCVKVAEHNIVRTWTTKEHA